MIQFIHGCLLKLTFVGQGFAIDIAAFLKLFFYKLYQKSYITNELVQRFYLIYKMLLGVEAMRTIPIKHTYSAVEER